MKRGFELLSGMVGTLIHAVTVYVWFFGDERSGEIGDVSIAFAGGRVLVMGCAGDGSVLITRGRKDAGNAPNMSTKRWAIPGLAGELRDVTYGDTWLGLEIGDRMLLLTNVDDQMEVAVDEGGLSEEVYFRSS